MSNDLPMSNDLKDDLKDIGFKNGVVVDYKIVVDDHFDSQLIADLVKSVLKTGKQKQKGKVGISICDLHFSEGSLYVTPTVI